MIFMTASILERHFDDGLKLRVRALEDGIFHLQAGGYDGYTQTLLDRYGFIERLTEDVASTITDFHIRSGNFALELTDSAGFLLQRGDEELLASLPSTRVATFPTVHGNRGWQLDLQLQPDDKLVGFGDQVRTRFLLNGQKDELWVRYPTKHVPVPFFMSSRGYGIFFNTTRRLRFDVGASDATRARFTVERDFLDAYIFTGDSYQELIEKYTRLTGRPILPPQKASVCGCYFIPAPPGMMCFPSPKPCATHKFRSTICLWNRRGCNRNTITPRSKNGAPKSFAVPVTVQVFAPDRIT
jgi:hypothetical protein